MPAILFAAAIFAIAMAPHEAHAGRRDGEVDSADRTHQADVASSAISQALDDFDKAQLSAALEGGAGTVTTAWRNPYSGNRYRLKMRREYLTLQGYCRGYTLNAHIASRPERHYGVACRSGDGRWLIVY